ncbi:MAG TPA: heavy metal sensor histidine kinase [Planctomicrobium sp.]|nr:heavy metal sensor histidine kinase [Planctomicrobium sp.]
MPQPWSLAAVLTTYYAASAFLIVLLTTAFLHWSMVRNVDRGTNQVLADRVRLLQSMMQEHAFDVATIVRLVGNSPESHVPSQFFVRVMNSHGDVVSETPGMAELISPEVFPTPSEPKSPMVSDLETSHRTFRLLAANAGTKEGFHGLWLIQAALDRSREQAIVRQSQRTARLTLAVAFVCCLGAGYGIARRGMRPLEKITETADSIRANSLDHRLETTGLPKELRQLADTFNAMLIRLQCSFNQLSQFSADIAHELRTPVNNLRGEVGVALGRSRSEEEYVEVLGSALEECDRLTRLIESLLFLTRAEHPRMQLERTDCDLRHELETVREFFGNRADELGVTLDVEAADGITAELNRPLLQRAVGNLVSNALTYTSTGGGITLRASLEGDRVSIEVRDSGCGISPEHLPHLFDRFYRADPSRTQSSGGMGLGLAIVKSVADLHSGTIEAHSTPGVGTTIRMRIPQAAPTPAIVH